MYRLYIKNHGRLEDMECDKPSNNLEHLLHDIYEKECKIKIEDEEKTLIKEGIETLVKKLVNRTHKNILVRESEWRGVRICKPAIINVGSFYEGTRNKYPDEFDFICVFCEGIEEYGNDSILDVAYTLDVEFEKSFQPVCMFYQIKGTLQYQETDKKEIVFGGYVKKHGPAHLLKFLYHKVSSGETRCINVDLVPAARVEYSGTRNSFTDPIIEAHYFIKAYRGGFLNKGQYLFVGETITFTEEEVDFIKTELTENHKKLYRILKYFLNGHGDNEKLAEFFVKRKIPEKVCSSYMIKSAVIAHHPKCGNKDAENIGVCVVPVLDNLIRQFKKNYNKQGDTGEEFCLANYINEISKGNARSKFLEELLKEGQSLSRKRYCEILSKLLLN